MTEDQLKQLVGKDTSYDINKMGLLDHIDFDTVKNIDYAWNSGSSEELQNVIDKIIKENVKSLFIITLAENNVLGTGDGVKIFNTESYETLFKLSWYDILDSGPDAETFEDNLEKIQKAIKKAAELLRKEWKKDPNRWD